MESDSTVIFYLILGIVFAILFLFLIKHSLLWSEKYLKTRKPRPIDAWYQGIFPIEYFLNNPTNDGPTKITISMIIIVLICVLIFVINKFI